MSVDFVKAKREIKAHYEFGSKSYTIVYDAISYSGTNPDEVEAAVFSVLPGGYFFNGTVLQSIDVDQNSDQVWVATANYSTMTPAQQDRATGVLPLDRPAVLTFHGREVSKIVEKDIDGNQICNSAGEKFLEGAEMRTGQATFSVVKNFASWTIDDSNTFIYHTNANVLFGMAPETLMCTNISGQQQSEIIDNSTFTFWQVTFEFESDTDKNWELWIEDRGLNAFVGGELKPATVKGFPVTTPVYLDGSGGQVPAGTAPPSASTLKFTVYTAVDFSPLGLDS